MIHEFIFSGIGGQGILLAGQLLCKAAVKKGHLVTWALLMVRKNVAVEPCVK